MSTQQAIPVNKKDLKVLFEGAGKLHQLQLQKSTDGLKKDLITIHKAHTAQLIGEIESTKEFHEETHDETLDRFDYLEERLLDLGSMLERLLPDIEVQRLKRAFISNQRQTEKRLAALEK